MIRCPRDPEFFDLERAHRGVLPPAATRDTLEHAERCPACVVERRALVKDHEWLSPPSAAVWSTERARGVARAALEAPPSRVPHVVLLAAAVAATAAIVLSLRPAPVPRPGARAPIAAAPAPARPAPPPSAAPAPADPSLGLAAGGTAIALGPDGSFRLERGMFAGVSFADGSAVAIAGPARGAVTQERGGPRVSLERGTIECTVQPQREGRRFVVEAGDATVLVRGTRFVVRRDEQTVDVEVSEGRVEVTQRGVTRTLEPGGPARRGRFVEWLEPGAPCGPLAEEGGTLVVEGTGSVLVDGVVLGPAPLRTHCRAGDLLVERRTGAGRQRMTSVLSSGGLVRLAAIPARSAPTAATAMTAAPSATPPADDVVGRARRLLADRRRAEARTLLEQHVAQHPADWSAVYWLGEAQRLSGDASAATASYQSVAERAPGLLAQNALASLALLAQTRGPAASLDAWDRYLARHPQGPVAAEALLGRAHALESLGRAAEARATYQRFLGLFPEHPRAAAARARMRGAP